MIYCHVFYKAKPGMIKTFYDELIKADIPNKIRANPGNVMYTFYEPVEKDPDTMFLLEYWKDQASLDAHLASEYRPLQNEIKNKYLLSADVKQISDSE